MMHQGTKEGAGFLSAMTDTAHDMLVLFDDPNDILGKKFYEMFNKYREKYGYLTNDQVSVMRTGKREIKDSADENREPEVAKKQKLRSQSHPIILPPLVDSQYFRDNINRGASMGVKGEKAKQLYRQPPRQELRLPPVSVKIPNKQSGTISDPMVRNSAQVYENLIKRNQKSTEDAEKQIKKVQESKRKLLPPRKDLRTYRQRYLGQYGYRGRLSFPDQSLDEPMSLRRKIEQFKQWHEQEYKTKKSVLPDDPVGRNEESSKEPENEISHTGNIASKEEKSLEVKSGNRSVASNIEVDGHSASVQNVGNSSPATNNIMREHSTMTNKTWKSWRNVNDSYAYDNVKTYIKDNELMNEEKEKWINSWLARMDSNVEEVIDEDESTYSGSR